MNKNWFLLSGLIALTVILASCGTAVNPSAQQPTASVSEQPPSASSNVVDIKIAGFAFTPTTLTVKAGTAVQWTNFDTAPHSITSDSGNELDSPSIGQGQSWSHVFEHAGTFAYHCGVHPSMKATITVTP